MGGTIGAYLRRWFSPPFSSAIFPDVMVHGLKYFGANGTGKALLIIHTIVYLGHLLSRYGQ
jgi:hypothetical protein